MLLAALRGRIGEAGHAVFHHGHVLAFHPQRRQIRPGEAGIQAALAAFGLPAALRVSGGKGQPPGMEGNFYHAVGHAGVDAHPKATAQGGAIRAFLPAGQGRHGPLGQPDGLLRVGQLARRIGRGRGQQRGPGQGQAQHAAGIVAVDPDVLPVQQHLHTEALVTPDETPHHTALGKGQQRCFFHGSSLKGTQGRGEGPSFTVRYEPDTLLRRDRSGRAAVRPLLFQARSTLCRFPNVCAP